jgi:hypothetical protein
VFVISKFFTHSREPKSFLCAAKSSPVLLFELVQFVKMRFSLAVLALGASTGALAEVIATAAPTAGPDACTESYFLERTVVDKATSSVVRQPTPRVLTMTGRSTTNHPYLIGEIYEATATQTRMSGTCRQRFVAGEEMTEAEKAECIKSVLLVPTLTTSFQTRTSVATVTSLRYITEYVGGETSYFSTKVTSTSVFSSVRRGC